MKQKAINLAKYYNCTASYSGKQRKMFIKGVDEAVKECVIAINSLLTSYSHNYWIAAKSE